MPPPDKSENLHTSPESQTGADCADWADGESSGHLREGRGPLMCCWKTDCQWLNSPTANIYKPWVWTGKQICRYWPSWTRCHLSTLKAVRWKARCKSWRTKSSFGRWQRRMRNCFSAEWCWMCSLLLVGIVWYCLVYPLVIEHSHGKSPFLIAING